MIFTILILQNTEIQLYYVSRFFRIGIYCFDGYMVKEEQGKLINKIENCAQVWQ